MTLDLVLATRNAAKRDELHRILAGAGIDVRLLTADDVDVPQVEETGQTFTENALLKARASAQRTGLPVVADDSGLVVDALDGEPGVYSARYAGGHGDDAANLEKVLAKMEGEGRRGARFVCVAALATPDGREWTVEGTVEGVLTDAPRGSAGFGYDPIFQPLGETRTTAEMTPQEKDAISHRGKAFRALAQVVAQLD